MCFSKQNKTMQEMPYFGGDGIEEAPGHLYSGLFSIHIISIHFQKSRSKVLWQLISYDSHLSAAGLIAEVYVTQHLKYLRKELARITSCSCISL